MISREVYAKSALDQIPRLLGNMDRNPFSPTFGCFHRDFWLDKTSDFPDAVRQFGVQALALVYSHKMPNNIYFGEPKILEWTIAAMDYWCSIQHNDGSFDEFYPNERGWVGPTAFTTYSIIESFVELQEFIPEDTANRIKKSIEKAAYFIAKGDQEEDHLANHHAMACLAVWKAHKLLEDDALLVAYKELWKGFLSYHVTDEGWSREYDGIDPGYLSATVSFLGKIYKDNKDQEILEVCKSSIETCSYFSYPNGFYGGSLGSRNTLHFYPHGFEVFGNTVPLAQSVAEKMLMGLDQGSLVPPAIMSDRYVFYRVPEFLQSYLDYSERVEERPNLPHEEDDLYKYFPKAKVWVKSDINNYIMVNAAKGGVVKVFDKNSQKLVLNDCGIIGKLSSGKLVTSQWIDEDYEVTYSEGSCRIKGRLNLIPSNKYFNVPKQILFRTFLLFLGWYPPIAHSLKGWIRKVLMLGNRPINIWFEREITINDSGVSIKDKIKSGKGLLLTKLSIGDEFFVRYVPQSRYFQSQELGIHGREASAQKVKEINSSIEWVEL